MSGKVERVSPKGKVYTDEPIESAAIREVGEETGIPADMLSIK
jgi:8-oxo-dGTP pyrophosphatase MutT (NUDIX family)